MKGIKCIAPVFDMSGYAQWSRSYILSLIDAGIPITVAPVSFESGYKQIDLGVNGEKLDKVVNKVIDYDHTIAWLVPDIAYNLFEKEPTEVKKICMSLWETDKLPDSWCKNMKHTDELWVCGEWNAEIYRRSQEEYAKQHPTFSPVPVKVVPYPVTEPKVSIAGLETLIDGAEAFKDHYKFYYISQWNERKNFKDLIYAYWSEFGPTEKVVLVLKTYANDHSELDGKVLQNELQRLADSTGISNLAPVMLIHSVLSSEQMTSLHCSCDCFVSPSRGEGLGLGIIESVLTGNPVVVNEFGEHSNYLLPHHRSTYQYGLTPVTGMAGYTWYSFDQSWAVPDVKGMADAMRRSFNYQEAAKRLALKGRDRLLKRFTPEETVKIILEKLSA